MRETAAARQEDKRHAWLDIVSTLCAFSLIYGLLIWLFPPSLLLSPTIIAGGDTLSHYSAATYLRYHLLPRGLLVGWMPGNFAGFPLFLFYFPLAFLFIVALSFLVPFPVAFKLGTVAGTFALPVAAYVALRRIGCRAPTPVLGAILSLSFLFIESNSMWGGNIPSTLAGEFAYSFSLPILVLFLGELYRGMETKQTAWPAGVLFALVGFSHGYTMVMAAGIALFLLITDRDRWPALQFLLKVYLIGGLLLGFWFLPLVVYLPYTSGWPITWHFSSILEVLPVILWPVIGVTFATMAYTLTRTAPSGPEREWVRQVHYLSFPIVLGILLFSLAARIKLVDIRFLSISQFFTTLVAAVGLGRAWGLLPQRIGPLALMAMALVTARWGVANQTYTQSWIGANYGGIQQAPLWPQFRDLNAALKGDSHDPRVVYEHSTKHARAGTIRVFEALPLFSGRSTLEGSYLQASLSSPFIFYLQSELTQTPSCPFPQYACSPFDPDRAVPHLVLFNVKQLIAISDDVKEALDATPAFRKRLDVQPYALYDVVPGDGAYVNPLPYQPVVAPTDDWKRLAYAWMQRPDWSDVFLIFPSGYQPPPAGALPFHSLDDAPPKVSLTGPCRVKETIHEQEIRFETGCPERPHLVKVSYHPKWRVEGADTIYLASPAFMMIYPTTQSVRLRFGNRWPDYVGWVATVSGVIWALWEGLAFAARKRYSQPLPRDPRI